MPDLTCPVCGDSFHLNPSKVKPINYCSKPCRGAAMAKAKEITPEEFWASVSKTTSCWIWKGPLSPFGYGTIRGGNKKVLAHRYSWELAYGPIPKGLNVLHDCPGGDNPSCVNPEHLFIGTQKDNMMDAARKNRTSYGEKNGQVKLTRE